MPRSVSDIGLEFFYDKMLEYGGPDQLPEMKQMHPLFEMKVQTEFENKEYTVSIAAAYECRLRAAQKFKHTVTTVLNLKDMDWEDRDRIIATRFKWVVEIELSGLWVEDGFQLTNENVKERIWKLFPHIYGDEFDAKVLKAPPPKIIRRIQGYKD